MGTIEAVGQETVALVSVLHGMVLMRRLFVAAFLLVAAIAFSNPFLGEWIVEQDRYFITDSHISGIMDGEPYETDYTYTDQTWIWRDRVWVYRLVTEDVILLVSILPSGDHFAPGYWIIKRINRESAGGI